MEQQKLPNAVPSIILSILGILCCCIFGAGIIPAGIAFYLTRKSESLHLENPDMYDNYSQIKTAKIIAIVAIVINVVMIIRSIYVIYTVGWDEIMERSREMQEQMGM